MMVIIITAARPSACLPACPHTLPTPTCKFLVASAICAISSCVWMIRSDTAAGVARRKASQAVRTHNNLQPPPPPLGVSFRTVITPLNIQTRWLM